MGFPFLLPAPRFDKCTREYRTLYRHFEDAAPPVSSFRAKARNLFRSRSIRKRGEDSGSREAPYTKRRGIMVLHADSITKEKGNGKRKKIPRLGSG